MAVRSVFLFLRDATEQTLDNLLQQIYRSDLGPRWVVTVDDDPCLYVNFYTNAREEFETNEWLALVEALGAEPAVSLQVDISGRHSGDQQVKEFVSTVLSNFNGVAMDDYTKHYWTLQEILSGRREEGHPFFDYNGRHRERQEQEDSRAIE